MADPSSGLSLPTRDLLKQMTGLVDESAAMFKGAESDIKASQEREGAARAGQQTALAPKREALKGALAEGGPAAPEFKAQPDAPPPMDTKDMGDMLALVTALSAMGGLLTRQPLTAALNAFTGGVQGYVQGKQEIFKNNIKLFDENLKKSAAENETIWKKYQAAREKHGANIQALQTELQLIAAETQSPIDMELAKRGDIVSLVNLHEKINANYEKVLGQAAKFMEQAEARKQHNELMASAQADRRAATQLAHEDRVAARGAAGGGDNVSQGAMVATGMPLIQAVPGYGNAAIAARRAAQDEAIKQIQESFGMTKIQAAQELARRAMAFSGIKGSVGQLQRMYGATKQAVSQLEFNIEHTTKAMDKLGSSDISPIINAIARGEEKWTGDPAFSELFFYMTAAGMESARILSGGQASIQQLHEGARNEAKQWASAYMTTPKAWKEGIAPAMLAEGKNRLQNFEHAIESQSGQLGAAPATDKPAPSAEDRAWAKSHPEDEAKFKAHFGVDP